MAYRQNPDISPERRQELEALVNRLAQLMSPQKGELVTGLSQAWGIAAPVTKVAPVTAPSPEVVKDTFSVFLIGYEDEKKLKVFLKVRDEMKLGLKEAKAFVEALPKAVTEDVGRPEAEAIAKRLSDVGAKVEIR